MNLFNLAAKLSLNSSEFDKGINDAKSGMSKLGDSLKKGLSTAAKAGTAAITAASGAVAALVKNSVKAYGDYEQLVGGVETLFGAGGMGMAQYAQSVGKSIGEIEDQYNSLMEAQNTVLENASNAYKTAGMSANQYMETAIGFSGALLKSLGGDTVKAAELTDTAISDMADQANKYGKTVEEISATYTSLARGNTQTLDNLFGGMFAGTKAGLQDMLTYAENYRKSLGETVHYSTDNYADILAAIHDVSEATGVYGTTANEAAGTIQGSIGMLKASWENLVTGFGNKDTDLGALIDEVVESAETALGNLAPVVERTIKSAAKAIRKLAPEIGKKLPGLITDLLPDLLSAGAELLKGIGQGLIEAAPALLETAKTLVNTTLDNLGIGDTVREFFDKISGPVSESWEKIKTSVTDAFERIKEAISPVTDAISEYLTSGQAMEDTTNFISTAVELLADGISKVADFIATVVEKGRDFVDWLTGGSEGAEAFKTAIVGITAALAAYKVVTLAVTAAQQIQVAWTKACEIAQGALNAVMNANPIGIIIAAITALVAAFIYLWNTSEDFRNFWINLWESIKEFATKAWEGIKEVFSVVGTWFKEKFQAARDGIVNAWSNIKEKFAEKWGDIKDAFAKAGEWFSEKFTKAKENALEAWSNIKEKASEIWGWFKDGFSISDALQWGKDMIQNFIDGIKQKWENLKSTISDIGQVIKDFLGFSEPKYGPLSNFHTFAPDMMKLFAEGIRDNEDLVTDQISKSFDFGGMTVNPAINNMGGGTQRATIGFDIDTEGLVRYLRPYIKNEDARVGPSMVM